MNGTLALTLVDWTQIEIEPYT